VENPFSFRAISPRQNVNVGWGINNAAGNRVKNSQSNPLWLSYGNELAWNGTSRGITGNLNI
jgi:hypothetical protein